MSALTPTVWHIDDRVTPRIVGDTVANERRRVMYDGYVGIIRDFRGGDGPGLEAFVVTPSDLRQTVAFSAWFRVDELERVEQAT